MSTFYRTILSLGSATPPALKQYVYVVTDLSSSTTARKFETDLTQITTGWPTNHGANLAGVAVDSQGNVIVVGTRVSNITTRKYSPDGTLLWSVDHGGNVNAVAVDSNDNIITVGVRNSNIGGVNRTTRKYNSSGSLTWSIDQGTTCNGVAIDNSDNILIAKNRTAGSPTSLVKLNSAGTLQWSKDLVQNGVDVDVFDGNKVVCVHNRDSSLTTRAYDSAGTLLFSRDHGATAMYAVAVDSNNNIFTAGQQVSSIVFRSYDSSGNALNTANSANAVASRSMAFDDDDNLYFTSTTTITKLANNLSSIDNKSTTGTGRGVAVSPPL
jgi:hypothetical protein